MIAVLFTSIFTAQGTMPSKRQQVTAKLTKPTTPSDIVEIVRKFNLEVKELYYVTGEIQGGYVVPDGEDIIVAIQNLMERHGEFLRETIQRNNFHLGELRDETEISKMRILMQQLEIARSEFESGKFTLSGIKVVDSESISQMMRNGIIRDVVPVPDQVPAPQSYNLQNKSPYIIKISLYHELWAPYGGTSDVNQSYTYQTFYFNVAGAFGSTSTYEHETQVYDKNFADYNNYWSSNLPNAYYDTPFADTLDNFTVGSAQASSIITYTQYFTYMALRPGSASSATVRIKGQKGFRSPSWCYSTWCIWPEATTSSMTTFIAPAGMSWQY